MSIAGSTRLPWEVIDIKRRVIKGVAAILVLLCAAVVFGINCAEPNVGQGRGAEPELSDSTVLTENIPRASAEPAVTAEPPEETEKSFKNAEAEQRTEETKQTAEQMTEQSSTPQNEAADKPEEKADTADKIAAVNENVCTLSVSCGELSERLEELAPEKRAVVPSNGIIYAENEVVFNEGETVFDILRRELKQNKIHMEFQTSPIYNTAYIEGIANIYEFDCGSLSGWTYKVNGDTPGYGCSQYTVKPGDRIEWIYVCENGLEKNE